MADFWLHSKLDDEREIKFQLHAADPITIGRAPGNTIVLDNIQVSRTHATLVWVPETALEAAHWLVTDAGSSGGTFVNETKLKTGETHKAQHGDTLMLGSVRMQLMDDQYAEVGVTMLGAGTDPGQHFERVQVGRAQDLAHKHLALLLEASATIHQSTNEQNTRRILVDSVAEVTRFENIAFVRSVSDAVASGAEVQVLESIGEVKDRTGKHRMSRTMLKKARESGVPIIVSDASKSSDEAMGASLQSMSVNRAICIPVQLDKMHFGFLYLDNGQARGDGGDEQRLREAASVADALTRMAAQNLGNLASAAKIDELWHATLRLVVDAIESRDLYTGGHSKRVAEFAKLLCTHAGMNQQETTLAECCARVHDIGKIKVDDAVLRKEGKLTSDEYAQIQEHPEHGYNLLKHHPQMQDVLPGVREHHEKWDGTGYPHKLAGEKISLLGRIIGIADVFDAITSERPYRHGFTIQKALAIIQADAGTHFDPALARVFLSIPHEQLESVHQHFKSTALYTGPASA